MSNESTASITTERKRRNKKKKKHYKKTGLSQRFQKRWDSPKKRWDSPKKRWDRSLFPIPAFFFPALQTAGQ